MRSDYPNIVLIGGAGGGKSTAAKFLAELGYTRLACAGVAEHPHKGSPRDVVTRVWGPEAVNDRAKLVHLGDGLRGLDPDVWINVLSRELDWTDGPVVIDDVRYPNEYWALKGRGFVSVRIEADDERRELRLKGNGKWLDGYLQNPIEHHLDHIKADHTITNDGSVSYLFDALAGILERERRRR